MIQPASRAEPAAGPAPLTCKWNLYEDGHRCSRSPAPRQGLRGPLREYCETADGPGQLVHNPANFWREQQRRRAAATKSQAEAATGPDPSRAPVTMTAARLAGADLLQSLRAEVGRIEGIVP